MSSRPIWDRERRRALQGVGQSMAEPLLDVKGLVAGYGGTSVLRGVDLSVEAGSIVAVLGANGVGKTTLNKVLSGIVRPQAGEVTFAGRRIDRASPSAI